MRSGRKRKQPATIGVDYEYEVKALSEASRDGLYDQNIVFLRVKAQCSGIRNQVLAEFMDGDWHVLIPNTPNDLLMLAIDKLVDYYAPKSTDDLVKEQTDAFEYDFALSDDMNEKLKKAVMLLDEVRSKLAQDGEEFTEDFVNELNQGTKRITDAVRRLEQDPIV